MRWSPSQTFLFCAATLLLRASAVYSVPIKIDSRAKPTSDIGTKSTCFSQFSGLNPVLVNGYKPFSLDLDPIKLRKRVSCNPKGPPNDKTRVIFNYDEAKQATSATKSEFTKALNGQQSAPFICDHIVELGLVKEALESPGGACDVISQLVTKLPAPPQQASELGDASKGTSQANVGVAGSVPSGETSTTAPAQLDKNTQTAVDAIISLVNFIKSDVTNAVNDKSNLVFVEKNLEAQKGLIVKSVLLNSGLVPLPTDTLSAKNANLKNRIEAAASYLNDVKAPSLAVAQKLDNLIIQKFPKTSVKVTDIWTRVLTKSEKAAEDPAVTAAIEAATAVGTPPPSSPISSTDPITSAPSSPGSSFPKAQAPPGSSGGQSVPPPGAQKPSSNDFPQSKAAPARGPSPASGADAKPSANASGKSSSAPVGAVKLASNRPAKDLAPKAATNAAPVQYSLPAPVRRERFLSRQALV